MRSVPDRDPRVMLLQRLPPFDNFAGEIDYFALKFDQLSGNVGLIVRGSREVPLISTSLRESRECVHQIRRCHRLSAQFTATTLPAAQGGSVDGLWSPSDLLMPTNFGRRADPVDLDDRLRRVDVRAVEQHLAPAHACRVLLAEVGDIVGEGGGDASPRRLELELRALVGRRRQRVVGCSVASSRPAARRPPHALPCVRWPPGGRPLPAQRLSAPWPYPSPPTDFLPHPEGVWPPRISARPARPAPA